MPASDWTQLPRARWKHIVDELLAGGLTVSRWSREHDVNARRLYYWIAKFSEEDAQLAGQARWLQLQAGEPPVPVSPCLFVFCNQRRDMRGQFCPGMHAKPPWQAER